MTWRTLLDIAEQTHAQIAGAALQRACGSAAPELVRAGALVRTAEAALLAPLTAWDSDDDAFDHGYEEGGVELTGARVRVVQPTHDPYVYRLNLDWMLRSAATALGIRRTAPLTETHPRHPVAAGRGSGRRPRLHLLLGPSALPGRRSRQGAG